MARMKAMEHLGPDGIVSVILIVTMYIDFFVPCLHSVGHPLMPGLFLHLIPLAHLCLLQEKKMLYGHATKINTLYSSQRSELFGLMDLVMAEMHC